MEKLRHKTHIEDEAAQQLQNCRNVHDLLRIYLYFPFTDPETPLKVLQGRFRWVRGQISYFISPGHFRLSQPLESFSHGLGKALSVVALRPFTLFADQAIVDDFHNTKDSWSLSLSERS